MKKVPQTQQQEATPKKVKTAPEWSVLKSGAMKHRDGNWFASPFSDGWFFYTKAQDGSLGPFKTFESGLDEWRKKK